MKTGRVASAGLLATALVMASQGLPGAAAAATAEPADPAAVQLSADYTVSYDEALRRVERQDAVSDLARALEAQVPDLLGSVTIDHKAGGAVVVRRVGADPRFEQEVARRGLQDVVRYEPAASSARQLAAAFRDLDRDVPQMQAASSPIGISVDPAKMRVTIDLVPDAPLTERQQAWVHSAQEKHGALVAVREAAAGVPAACAWPSCDAPLRGGLWISPDVLGSNTCTSGFVAQSKTDANRRFLITAGHCQWGEAFQKQVATGTFVRIGARHANSYYNGQGDAALYTVDSNATWSPAGWVYVRSSTSNGVTTTENASYPIKYTGTAAAGAYVCHTGATIGTRCGEVLSPQTTSNYAGFTVGNLAEVRFTGCQGDSGGPVYRNNTAYGIYVGLRQDAGTSTAPSGQSVACGFSGWYSLIGPVLTNLNVNLSAG